MAVENNPIFRYLKDAKYTDVRPLDSGCFGDVLSALSPQKKEVAIKIIKKSNSWIIEEEIWPILYHPHILPVLNVVSLPDLGLKLFISPKHPTSLFLILQSQKFRADPGALNRLRKWMKHVLGGLEYLHKSGFAHMDIKTDNVLISSQDSALLCDFSGLAITKLKVRRLCAPLEFRPPECWNEISLNGVEAVPFDIWTYGLLVLNALAGQWPNMQITYGKGWTWEKNAKPILGKALQKENLGYLMKQSMPQAPIQEEDVQSALNFLTTIMKLNPSERPTARQAAAHSFLCTNPFKFTPAIEVHTSVPVRNHSASVPVARTFVVCRTQNIEQVMASGDGADTALEVDTESLRNSNETCLPPPIRTRRGFGKKLVFWLAKKVRGLAVKRHGYVPLENMSN